jgi:hypothetical protein
MEIVKSVVIIFLRLVRLVIDQISDVVYKYLYESQRKNRLPPFDNELLLLPATELAEKIRTQEVKAVTVVLAFKKRLEEVNPIINAVVDTCFDQAIIEAQTADEEVENAIRYTCQ